MGKIVGIHGTSGCGKTWLVEQVIERLSKKGFSCQGIYSPGQFENGVKTGIYTRLIPDGETRILAQLALPGDAEVLGKWKMFPETVEWAKAYLSKPITADLWIIDEIGPYEIGEDKGWASVLADLHTRPFLSALITYRPGFSDYFAENYPGIIQFNVEPPNARQQVIEWIENWMDANTGTAISKPG
ncbi:MAG: nucleoside-triphosphatase [Anaerolineaceae bacterium]